MKSSTFRIIEEIIIILRGGSVEKEEKNKN